MTGLVSSTKKKMNLDLLLLSLLLFIYLSHYGSFDRQKIVKSNITYF